jgi:hypothetical protein
MIFKNMEILTEIFSCLDLRDQFRIRCVNKVFMSVYDHLKNVRMYIDPDKHVFYHCDEEVFFRINEIEDIDNSNGNMYRYICRFEVEKENIIEYDEEEIYDENGCLIDVSVKYKREIKKIIVERRVAFDCYGTPWCYTPSYFRSNKVRKYDKKQLEFYRENWWGLVPMRRFL